MRAEIIPIAMGVIVAVAAVGGAVALSTHTVCQAGGVLADENLWTPFSLANAPYLGSTQYGASFSDIAPWGAENVTLSDGTVGSGNVAAGFIETQNWTVWSAWNESIRGDGPNQPCTSGYLAALSHPSFNVAVDGAVLQGPGNTSNVNEPTTYSYGVVSPPSLSFSNGFAAPTQPPITTCGGAAIEANVSSGSFTVHLTLPSLGGTPVPITIQSTESFVYHFPANAGTWQVDNLSAPGGPGGGWAFDFAPCS